MGFLTHGIFDLTYIPNALLPAAHLLSAFDKYSRSEKVSRTMQFGIRSLL